MLAARAVRCAARSCFSADRAEPDAYCLVEYRLGHLASALRGNRAGLTPILVPRFAPLYKPIVYFHRRNVYPAIVSAHGESSEYARLTRDAALMWSNVAGNLGLDDETATTTIDASRFRPCAHLGCTRSESAGVEFQACGGCRVFCASVQALLD